MNIYFKNIEIFTTTVFKTFGKRFKNSVTSTINGEASTSLVTEFGTKGIGFPMTENAVYKI